MLAQVSILVALSLSGGIAPFLFRRSDRVLHLLVAFATGTFLGVIFLHLLPEVGELAARPGGDGVGGAVLWGAVLAGVVGLFLLESLVLARVGAGDEQRHLTVSYASLAALCAHALTTGIGLGVAGHVPALFSALFLSVVSHKLVESFSLTTVFLLAGTGRRGVLGVQAFFALVTPLGLLAGTSLQQTLPESSLGVLMGLAAGTFLFVALYDLLPEVFHHPVDAAAKVALLGAGIVASALLHGLH